MKQKTLSISDAEKLTPSAIGKAFHERYAMRSKAFLEQGKLVYALSQKSLPQGQSVQSIITSKGVPSGSVDNARKAAAILEALVVPGIVSEATFDKVATFRLARLSYKLLGLGRNDEQVLDAEALGEIISQKAKPAEIGDILECWHEHGKSPEDHKAELVAQAEEAKRAEQEAAKRAEEVAEDDAQFDSETDETPETPEAEADEPTVIEDDENAPEDDEPTVIEDASEEAPEESQAPSASSAVTVDDVLEALYQVRIDATELDSAGLSTVLLSVNEFQQELIDALNAQKVTAQAA